MGDVASDLSLFMGAVIDGRAFAKHAAALDRARNTPSIEILAGGQADDTEGFFVRPTILQSPDPADEIFTTEYFGPILAVHVYPDAAYEQTLSQAADVAPYALTGSILATNREAIAEAADVLRYSAGNFYINDKPTGAVVGQQPFGGARASGTDDKAGGVQPDQVGLRASDQGTLRVPDRLPLPSHGVTESRLRCRSQDLWRAKGANRREPMALRAARLAENRVHHARRRGDLVGDLVAVNRFGHCRVHVPHDVGDLLYVHTGVRQHRHERVPLFTGCPAVPDTGPAAQRLEPAPDILGPFGAPAPSPNTKGRARHRRRRASVSRRSALSRAQARSLRPARAS